MTLAEPAEGSAFTRISAFCKKRKCTASYGFAEKEGELPYNASALVGPDGLLGIYRKVHLFDRETILFEKGNLGFPVFDLPFGKVGMMICFDWMFPESARTLTLKGAQLIIHPSNLVMPYCPDAMVTRCLENRVFAATADRVGMEDRGGHALRYIGASEIVTPRGEILMRLGSDREETGLAEIDLSLATNKRINAHNDLLSGRRPEYYA